MSAARAEVGTDGIAYHASLADAWERRYRKPTFRTRQAVLLKCLQGRNLTDSVWLDAGCGTGTLARWLAERGCSVLGVDAASAMVAAATQSVQTENYSDRLSFVQIQTIARLALDDRSLDGILCSSVLEYVSDPSACLNEFSRVLKPGGLLLVSIPNRNSVVRRMQLACHHLSGLLGQRWLRFLDYSRHQYSRCEFERLLVCAGFSSEQFVPFGSPLPRLAQRSRHWAPLLMFVAEKARMKTCAQN
jgi:2-polyprenyl-6-hydroxyphenyl methylase/3-demethylubiquinone-9 3-methyltransferase